MKDFEALVVGGIIGFLAAEADSSLNLNLNLNLIHIPFHIYHDKKSTSSLAAVSQHLTGVRYRIGAYEGDGILDTGAPNCAFSFETADLVNFNSYPPVHLKNAPKEKAHLLPLELEGGISILTPFIATSRVDCNITFNIFKQL